MGQDRAPVHQRVAHTRYKDCGYCDVKRSPGSGTGKFVRRANPTCITGKKMKTLPSTAEQDVRNSYKPEQRGSNVHTGVRMAQWRRTFFPPSVSVVSLALVMMMRISGSATAASRPAGYMHAIVPLESTKHTKRGNPPQILASRSGVEQVVRQEDRRASEQGFGDLDVPHNSKLKLFTHDVALRSDSGECWFVFLKGCTDKQQMYLKASFSLLCMQKWTSHTLTRGLHTQEVFSDLR
jgi:hypothetical protein